jgi:hypothetical protein
VAAHRRDKAAAPTVGAPGGRARAACVRRGCYLGGMAGKLRPQTQQKLAILAEFVLQLQRVHGLVEKFATTRGDPDPYVMPIRRAFQQLKMKFMGAGLDAQSQLCGSMEMAVSRGGSQLTKSRILREGVGSLRFQLELEQRSLVSADMSLHDEAKDDAPEDAPDEA